MTLEEIEQTLRPSIQKWDRLQLERQYIRLWVVTQALNQSQVTQAEALRELTNIIIGKFESEQSSSDRDFARPLSE